MKCYNLPKSGGSCEGKALINSETWVDYGEVLILCPGPYHQTPKKSAAQGPTQRSKKKACPMYTYTIVPLLRSNFSKLCTCYTQGSWIVGLEGLLNCLDSWILGLTSHEELAISHFRQCHGPDIVEYMLLPLLFSGHNFDGLFNRNI